MNKIMKIVELKFVSSTGRWDTVTDVTLETFNDDFNVVWICLIGLAR